MQKIEAGGRNKSGVERHPLFILIASSRIAHWNSWFSGGLPAVTVHPLGRCGPWPEQQQPPAPRSRNPIHRRTGDERVLELPKHYFILLVLKLMSLNVLMCNFV